MHTRENLKDFYEFYPWESQLYDKIEDKQGVIFQRERGCVCGLSQIPQIDTSSKLHGNRWYIRE